MTSFNKLCRACLSSKESFQYVLFENVSPNIYSYCTSIEIIETEDLPKTICDNCHELLLKLFSFKQTCMKSENTLLQCSSHVKIESNALSRLDEDSQCENIENGFEIETNCIKKELVDSKICSNEDLRNIEHDTALPIKNEEINNGNSKTHLKRLRRRVSSPKQVVGKSISKINLSTSKKPQIYSCKLCKKIFSYLERYEAHKLEHEGQKVSISCTECNRTFATWSGLKRHKESEHIRINLDSLMCKICGKTSKNRHTLRMHEKIHQQNPCICDICGRKFVSNGVLKTHLQSHEKNRERRHECVQCGKKFFSITVLQSHVSKQHSGKKFVCQICSFVFTEKSNLIRHIRLHEGKKLYKCDICDKSFATGSSLVEHKRIHSGERPFSCIYCPKSFAAKKRLDDHHRIHTGEKPHKCSVCGQGFTQRGTLKRHLRVHDKFTPALA